MSNMNSDKEIKITVCRICLAQNSADMVFLDQQNGWLTLFEYCVGIALTIQDKPRVICKSCAVYIKSYAKFKDLCLKSDKVWKSMIANVKCNISKTLKLEESIIQSTERNLQSSKNELLTNENELFEIPSDNDSNIFCNNNDDMEFTATKFDSSYYIESIKEETIDEADENVNQINSHLQQLEVITNEVDTVSDEEIENQCKNDNSDEECSKYTKNLHSESRINLNGKEFYTCSKCKKKYTKKKWYLTHEKVCTSKSSKNHILHLNKVDNCVLFCGLCKYNGTSFDMLCKHLDEHWSNNDLACKLCEFIGHDLADITAHRFSHFPSKWLTRFRCHICQEVKFSKLSLHFHYRLVHLKKSGGFCSRCNKEFKGLKSWKVHEKAHVTPEFICDICGKNFPYKYRIRDHMLSHTNLVQNICHVCGKSFKRTRYLHTHLELVHGKSKPLKCTHCNKIFKNMHSLKIHRKTSTNDKPYKCEVCFKEFYYIQFLKSHMRWHSDERPHCCDICGSKYKSKGQLTVHMRKHTGILPFKCMTCSKEFASTSQLKIHSSVHTGIRRHRCMFCTRTFNSRRHWVIHCNLQHKNEIVKTND